MRAAWYEKNGAAADVLRLGEMPDPEPGPGKFASASWHPASTPRTSRSGPARVLWVFRASSLTRTAPASSTVWGPACRLRVSASASGSTSCSGSAPFGTAAEYVCVPAARAVTLPAGASFAEGACLGIPGVTAHLSLFADGPLEGTTVLVTGGAGAVGHYAVQLAKWAGARVIATVSSPGKAAAASAAGADHTVNYRTEDVAAQVLKMTDGAGVDRIVDVDFGANLASNLKVLKPHGVLAAYSSPAEPEPKLPFYALMRNNATVRAVLIYTARESALAAATRDIVRLVEAGRLIHQIGARFPLARIVEAHEAQESGKVMGNIVLEVAPESG